MNSDNSFSNSKKGFFDSEGEFYPEGSQAYSKPQSTPQSQTYVKGDDGELYPKRPDISYTTMSFNAPAAQQANQPAQNIDNNISGYTGPTKYCRYCGNKIPEKAVICTHCGCQVEEMNASSNAAPTPVIVNNNINNANVNTFHAGRAKNKWLAFLLCLLGGVLGLHKFYEGKIFMGLLYMFTAGLGGIGVIIDLIALLCKPNPYYID